MTPRPDNAPDQYRLPAGRRARIRAGRPPGASAAGSLRVRARSAAARPESARAPDKAPPGRAASRGCWSAASGPLLTAGAPQERRAGAEVVTDGCPLLGGRRSRAGRRQRPRWQPGVQDTGKAPRTPYSAPQRRSPSGRVEVAPLAPPRRPPSVAGWRPIHAPTSLYHTFARSI